MITAQVDDIRLAQLLLDFKLVIKETLNDAVLASKKYGVSLYEIILEQNPVLDAKIGEAVAKELKLPFAYLADKVIDEKALYLLPESFARKYQIITFGYDGKSAFLAMSNPTNSSVIEMVKWKTKLEPVIHFATPRDILNAMQLYSRDLQKVVNTLLRQEARPAMTVLAESAVDAPVVKIVDAIVDFADKEKVSDIHIEAEEKESLVRFRVDGVLRDILHLPKPLHDRIITRIKVLSNLRTDEHLSAQDGKMRVFVNGENLDIRVSILPIVDGEKAVLRLLSSHAREYSLTDLGMNRGDLDKVANAFSRSFGMILSTGPTGSGKTTSIYAILKNLNLRERNITTIEDPVEYRILGANQVQVNVKTNLTFANGLRSILRQDPNIIFVGEIRDNETASIAVNAALTGHLVFSTLHTNDAATAIPRLIDMKVEPFLVASTVNVVVAQRLVRKVCQFCKNPTLILKETVLSDIANEKIIDKYLPSDKDGQVTVYQGKGCKQCRFTGYSGRIGIFEVLVMSKKIRELVGRRADSDIILDAAVAEGMKTMLMDGLEKVAGGLTTLEEVLRAVKSDSG